MKTIEDAIQHFPDIDFNEDYLKALTLLSNTDTFINIIGEAGSGKSTLLRIMNYMLDDSNVLVCATTGVASALLNSEYSDIKATTLHSALKIKPYDIYSPSMISRSIAPEAKDIIESMEYLIIDESSMMSSNFFDHIIELLTYIRGIIGKDLPRIITFGDIMQLPPVIKSDIQINRYYDEVYGGNHYFFNSNAFKDRNFITICLHKSYRQNKDNDFKDILNRIRVGKQTKEDLDTLNKRVLDDDTWVVDHERSLRICTTNKTVAIYNQIALDMIDNPEMVFHADITGEFRNSPEYKSGNYPDDIKLKIGCPVMITRNDTSPDKAFVNGDMGKLISCDTDTKSAVVSLGDEGNEYQVTVPSFKTEIYDYKVEHNGDRSEVIPHCIGSYENIALRVCASITVHKCQGLTINGYGYFDKGYRNGWVSESGIYVALSRFRSLDHIGLKYPIIPQDIKINHEAIKFMESVKEGL